MPISTNFSVDKSKDILHSSLSVSELDMISCKKTRSRFTITPCIWQISRRLLLHLLVHWTSACIDLFIGIPDQYTVDHYHCRGSQHVVSPYMELLIPRRYPSVTTGISQGDNKKLLLEALRTWSARMFKSKPTPASTLRAKAAHSSQSFFLLPIQ